MAIEIFGFSSRRLQERHVASRTDPYRLSNPTVTASSPMSVQGQPAVIVSATTQTPKAIIPAEIRNESTVSMIGPPFFRAKRLGRAWTVRGARGWDRRREIRPAAPVAQTEQAAGATRPHEPRPTDVNWLSCGVCGARRRLFDGASSPRPPLRQTPRRGRDAKARAPAGRTLERRGRSIDQKDVLFEE